MASAGRLADLDGRGRVVLFMVVLLLPFALVAAWFVLLVVGTAVFIRLMLRALAEKERV